MKANMDLKNPKRCGGILHKDLWKMLHPKFISLFCVPHLFFKYRFSSFFLDVTKSSSFFFFKLFYFDGYFFFIGEPFVKQKCKHYVNRRWEGNPCSKFWNKNICSFRAQRGNKGSHFVFYDKETWPHIISKTWLFSLSRNFNSGKNLVHVTVCPLLLFLSLFF